MKRLVVMVTIGCMLCVLCVQACAITDIQTAQLEAYGVSELEKELPEEAYQVWGDVTVKDASQPQTLLQTFWEKLTGSSQELLSSASHNAAVILLLCFVIAVVQTIPMDSGQAKLCSMIGAVSVTLVCMHEASGCVPMGFQVIETLSDFSGKLLPALCAAAAAGGAVTSAGAKYAFASVTLDLLNAVMLNLMRPAFTLYITAVAAGNVLQNEVLLSLTGFLKRMLRLLLIGTAILFTGYLALTGILNGAVDKTAAKAAKTTISAALPVVGKILSDAAETVVSGAGILRAGIGSLGLLCVLAVCVVPYASLGVHYLIYQLIGGFISAFSDKRIAALLQGFSDVYAMMLGAAGTVTFVLFASIVSLMQAVSL